MNLSSAHTLFAPEPELTSWIRGIRRTIHQYPETAFEEFQTARLIADKLQELGISFRGGIAGTGIVATLGAAGPGGPCVALRADMDALPVQEETGLEFSSRRPGFMHACGHDGHVAMLLGAAALLSRLELPGRVVLLFQPGEEKGAGARDMIQEGALDGVHTIFGGHIDRHFRVGEISVEPGLICAYTDSFRIEVAGRGGHAAKPHETVDSIVVASLLVMSIQTLVSREVNPAYPTVVTVGRIEGGSAANVIAAHACLEGTIRTTHREVRPQIMAGLRRMVGAMGQLYNATTSIEILEGYPPVINDPGAVRLAREAAAQVVGRTGVVAQPHPSLGGEDFAYYLEKIPGCFVRFGALRDDLQEMPAHSPKFDFDEGVLPLGASFLAAVALLALQRIGEKHEPLVSGLSGTGE